MLLLNVKLFFKTLHGRIPVIHWSQFESTQAGPEERVFIAFSNYMKACVLCPILVNNCRLPSRVRRALMASRLPSLCLPAEAETMASLIKYIASAVLFLFFSPTLPGLIIFYGSLPLLLVRSVLNSAEAVFAGLCKQQPQESLDWNSEFCILHSKCGMSSG